MLIPLEAFGEVIGHSGFFYWNKKANGDVSFSFSSLRQEPSFGDVGNGDEDLVHGNSNMMVDGDADEGYNGVGRQCGLPQLLSFLFFF